MWKSRLNPTDRTHWVFANTWRNRRYGRARTIVRPADPRWIRWWSLPGPGRQGCLPTHSLFGDNTRPRGKVYRVTRQSSPHEGTAMRHGADAWPPCMQEKTANRGLPGEADGVAVSQKGRVVQTQQRLYFRRKVSAPTGNIEFVRQDDAGLHLPGHCDITGP